MSNHPDFDPLAHHRPDGATGVRPDFDPGGKGTTVYGNDFHRSKEEQALVDAREAARAKPGPAAVVPLDERDRGAEERREAALAEIKRAQRSGDVEASKALDVLGDAEKPPAEKPKPMKNYERVPFVCECGKTLKGKSGLPGHLRSKAHRDWAKKQAAAEADELADEPAPVEAAAEAPAEQEQEG